jgi:hypothetical protein
MELNLGMELNGNFKILPQIWYSTEWELQNIKTYLSKKLLKKQKFTNLI